MRNLTEVALKNKVLVWYFIVVTAIGGIFAYNKLGRMEDPQFTIRQMVVSAAWPGATAQEMQEQVTDIPIPKASMGANNQLEQNPEYVNN